MKNKKGFNKEEVLIINLHEMDDTFKNLFYKIETRKYGYNKYCSEFTPCGDQNYGNTFKIEKLEKYWKNQANKNNYKGTLEDFIKDYQLEMDVWFINCGYDFTDIKIIIINA